MPAPKAKAKAKAKVKSAASMMQEVADRMDSMMAEYQQTIAEYQRQYEEMVGNAQAQLAAVAQLPEAPPKREPQAVWHEETGEKLLVLNKEAADFFMAIFENVGVLADELQKMNSRGKK